METNEENLTTVKIHPPIFIKTKVHNYKEFFEEIKNKIEPTNNFTCKSSFEFLK